MALVAIDLVEGFFEFQAPAFELDLYKGQAVYQYSDIVAVFISTFLGDLVGDLVTVLAPVLVIEEADIKGITIIPIEMKSIPEGLGLLKYIAFGQVIGDGIKLLF